MSLTLHVNLNVLSLDLLANENKKMSHHHQHGMSSVMSNWSLTPADQLEFTPAISWRLRRQQCES